MISTIFYDWGGVLIEQGPHDLHQYWADALGVQVSDLQRTAEPHMPRFQLGLVSEADFWGKVCESLGVRPPPGPLWQAGFRRSYVEHDAVLNLARKLRDDGYGIGLISNTEKPTAELFMEKMSADSRYAAFEYPVFSCDVGCAKPDPEIFHEAISRHGTRPSHCVFLDDSEENIHAAKVLGMHTILVVDPVKSVDDLSALLAAAATGRR